ncbi:TRMT1 isoform X2 [Pelobates cultripes]|uniref:tRNA (guanine(26)-N(2))-dimethyltransferase n=1 Tax=Pelobates cultripes TaxID=61616 RepID=A0AAD1SWZ4_PELCU|nr:TRMT1 isoform X2 [Pelobates cultripes]
MEPCPGEGKPLAADKDNEPTITKDPLLKQDMGALNEEQATDTEEHAKSEPLCNRDVVRKVDRINVNPVQNTQENPLGLVVDGKHISIQKDLSDLETLAGQGRGDKKQCPLCPEERFRPCHIHKLLKHLQNFHWKVSVEFEGYRMCICCLPCLQRNASQSEGEVPSKIVVHYHCIICSAAVAKRRCEMLNHIKRHINKGETEVKLSAPTCRMQEILHESNTDVQVLPNFNTPHKSGTFFNPKMKTNRQLIFCALAVLVEERSPLECLDAFGSTGVMGLQWAKHLGTSVKVTINDISEQSVAMIRENCALNKMKVLEKKEEEAEEESELLEGEKYVGSVEVTQLDANVLMHLRSFDFIHLDPFGTSVNYLDAAFRNVRNMGIISVTSTDTGSLYAKTLHVAKRHYGCNIIRTEYFKELAARIVLCSIARLNKILQYLSEAGFLVSRTHFDPTGIRTDAPLATLTSILTKNSTLSTTSQSSSHQETSIKQEKTELEETESVSENSNAVNKCETEK